MSSLSKPPGSHSALDRPVPFGSNVMPFTTNMPSRPTPPRQDELTLSDLGPVIRQMMVQIRSHWIAGAIAALLLIGAAGWFFFRSVPEYTAETTLLAQSSLDKILNAGESPDLGPQSQGENSLRNHLSTMTSRTFLTKVADGFSPTEKAMLLQPYQKEGQQPKAEDLIDLLFDKIDIERERGRDFFTITVKHRTPEVAVMLADRFTSRYLAYVQSEYRAASQAATALLQRQAESISVEMRRIEDQRREYRKTYNLMSVEENQGIIAERLRRINTALSDVRVQRVSLETQLKQARADLAVTTTPFSNPILAAFGNNQALRVELDRLRGQREMLVSEYGPNHPKMIEATRALAGIQETLGTTFKLAMADLQGKFDLAVSSESQLTTELNTAFGQSLDIDKLAGNFNTLGDELDAQRKTQAVVLKRIADTSLSRQLPTNLMSVVDPPYVQAQSLKRQLLFAMLVMMLATVAFIGVPLIIHLFDEHLSASADLESVLHKELLGAVPKLTKTRVEDRPHLVRDNVNFPLVESFLGIVSQVDLTSKKPLPRRLLITSTLSGEGKSMCASNIAATYTRFGRRTLLVDLDFRRPTQASLQQVPETRGVLPWAVDGFKPAANLCKPDGVLGIVALPDGTFFLPAGGMDGQPTRHLISPHMAALFEQLSEEYDVVIIDTPPAGIFQDALILAKYCHETIVIGRDGLAQTSQVKRTITELDKTQAPVIGVVINAFSPGATHHHMAYRHLTGKYGYGYGYGYGKDNSSKKSSKPARAKATA